MRKRLKGCIRPVGQTMMRKRSAVWWRSGSSSPEGQGALVMMLRLTGMKAIHENPPP